MPLGLELGRQAAVDDADASAREQRGEGIGRPSRIGGPAQVSHGEPAQPAPPMSPMSIA